MILQLLNVLIGLTLIYLIFSTIASALFELLEGLIRQRGKLLARGIKEILRHRSPDVAADLRRFYEHPLINSLYEGEFSERAHALPSYIPPEHFARAVLMLAEDADPEAATTDPFVQLRAFAQRLVGQRPVAEGESQVQALEAAIVAHFNASMDRVGGWFGRYARAVLLGIGLLLASWPMSIRSRSSAICRWTRCWPIASPTVLRSTSSSDRIRWPPTLTRPLPTRQRPPPGLS